MIKNKKNLIKNSSFPKQAKKALQIIEAGLKTVDAKKAVEKANLPNLKKFNRIFVVGFGKAAAEMAEAIEKRLGKKIAVVFIIGTRKAKTKRIKSFVGTHPLPSKKNCKVAQKILEISKRSIEELHHFAT